MDWQDYRAEQWKQRQFLAELQRRNSNPLEQGLNGFLQHAKLWCLASNLPMALVTSMGKITSVGSEVASKKGCQRAHQQDVDRFH